MAFPTGLEPVTYALEERYSILLSYGNFLNILQPFLILLNHLPIYQFQYYIYHKANHETYLFYGHDQDTIYGEFYHSIRSIRGVEERLYVIVF